MQSQHFKVSLNRKNPIWGAKLVEWFLMYCIIILKIYFTLVLPLDFFFVGRGVCRRELHKQFWI